MNMYNRDNNSLSNSSSTLTRSSILKLSCVELINDKHQWCPKCIFWKHDGQMNTRVRGKNLYRSRDECSDRLFKCELCDDVKKSLYENRIANESVQCRTNLSFFRRCTDPNYRHNKNQQ